MRKEMRHNRPHQLAATQQLDPENALKRLRELTGATEDEVCDVLAPEDPLLLTLLRTGAASPTLSPQTRVNLPTRVSLVDQLDLATVVQCQCPNTNKPFLGLHLVNSHPVEEERYQSPYTMDPVFAAPQPDINTSTHRSPRRNAPSAGVDATEEVEVDDWGYLSQRMLNIRLGLQRRLEEYVRAHFPAKDCVVSCYTTNISESTGAGSPTKGVVGTSSPGSPPKAMNTTSLTLSILMRIQAGEGASWTVAHVLGLEASPNGSRYLLASRSLLHLNCHDDEKQNDVSFTSSASYHQRSVRSVTNQPAGGQGGGATDVTAVSSAGSSPVRRRSDNLMGESQHSVDEEAIVMVLEMIDGAESNFLLPETFNIQLPRCAALAKLHVRRLDERQMRHEQERLERVKEKRVTVGGESSSSTSSGGFGRPTLQMDSECGRPSLAQLQRELRQMSQKSGVYASSPTRSPSSPLTYGGD